MHRLIGIVVAVAVLWTIVEVYTHGTRGAFGGRLADLLGEDNTSTAESTLSAPQRARDAVKRAHERQQQRYDDLLAETD